MFKITQTELLQYIIDYHTLVVIKNLKKKIKELEDLLVAAKQYDENNNQKDCSLEEKKKFIKDLADKFEIEVNFP